MLFHLFSDVCCKCFVWMLHNVANGYVASVCFECFIRFRRMLRCRCGGSLSPQSPAAVAHESGRNGMPRQIGWDGRWRSARAGWDAGLHSACVGSRRGKVGLDSCCLRSGDGRGASVGHHPTYAFVLASCKRINPGMVGWTLSSPLTTKVRLNSPQYLINLHMDHYGPNSKLGQM
jgi:hypothetical protein